MLNILIQIQLMLYLTTLRNSTTLKNYLMNIDTLESKLMHNRQLR